MREVSLLSRDDSCWESRFGLRVLRGPRRESSARTAATSLRSVRQVSVEVDRGVCAMQNGLFEECPQRHIAIGSGCSITRPSGAVRTTGPETMYGPSSLGVMVTSAMCCDLSLVDLDRLGEGSSTHLNDWSATSRAASGQSPAASVWRTASTASPWSANHRGGPMMEVRNLIAEPSAELQTQKIRQQLVVAKPRALRVERHDERVGVLKLQQQLLRARAASQQVGEFTVQPVDKRGSQQHALNLARLAFEHLAH
jgi:hypothetical protein